MSEKKIRALLDAGHYGNYNQSPVVPEYWESRVMWKLHHLLKAALEEYGIEVDITRPDQEEDLPVYQRGYLAKAYDIFLSLHSNAAKSEDVDRVDVYAPYDNINNSHDLAAKLGGVIAEIMEKSESFVKTRQSGDGSEYYGVLRGARAAGCPLFYIIEHSFHTNEAAARWLFEEENLKRLADAESAVIAEWFGIKTKYTIGDADGDGDVDARDYILIKRAVMGTYEMTEEQENRSDINGDGRVDARDYVLAKRIHFGTYSVEPVTGVIPEPEVPALAIGDKVKLCETATTYADGDPLPDWAKNKEFYVRAVEDDGVILISTYKVKEEYTGRVNVADVYKV